MYQKYKKGIAKRSEQRPQEPRHQLGMPWLVPWLVWGSHAIGRTDWYWMDQETAQRGEQQPQHRYSTSQ